ncbi:MULTISPECIES: DoxX family protein [Lysobacter]|uniref:DoxX family protein n=1 Tax=Lysobacter firmicutimachus TaxID=1792846 RepID=A0ABU8D1G5_9GAMM|nr:DoxX family protein [Lysobacter antibioticus]
MNAEKSRDLALLVLRLSLGALILLHGIAKLRGGLDGIVGMVQAQGLPGFLGYGVLVGEVLAPLLLILGWHARVGAALIAANMLAAIGLVHLGQLGQLNEQGGWAIELQAMFLAAAVAIALAGPGRHSLDGR